MFKFEANVAKFEDGRWVHWGLLKLGTDRKEAELKARMLLNGLKSEDCFRVTLYEVPVKSRKMILDLN